MQALESAVGILEGAYSFVVISVVDPDAMFIVKNTGTMVIGFPESLVKDQSNASEVHSLESMSSIGDED